MTELNDLRGEIDRIDGELTALFARRMEVSARIARCKAERGLPVLDASREADKLQSIADMLPPELREDGKQLYTLLFALSRGYQEKLLRGGGE